MGFRGTIHFNAAGVLAIQFDVTFGRTLNCASLQSAIFVTIVERTPAILLAVALILTAGCRTAREAEIPGEYTAKLDWGESKLVIKADHTFEQTVTVKANNEATRKVVGNGSSGMGLSC